MTWFLGSFDLPDEVYIYIYLYIYIFVYNSFWCVAYYIFQLAHTKPVFFSDFRMGCNCLGFLTTKI